MSRLTLWLAALALAGGSPPSAGDSSAEPPTLAARSALVTLEASAAPSGLALRLRRTANQTPLPATDLTVSVEGRSVPATAGPDGSWSVPLARPVAPGDTLEVVVAHDGIREVLSGRFAVPGASAAGGGGSGVSPAGASAAGGVARVWRDHKQMAWWILNIAVVLIAAIAISRRMS